MHVWRVFTVHGVNRSIPCSVRGSIINILNGGGGNKPKLKGLSIYSTLEHLKYSTVQKLLDSDSRTAF